jgi:hypothetical protein
LDWLAQRPVIGNNRRNRIDMSITRPLRSLGTAVGTLFLGLAAQAQSVTLNSLLQEMADRDALARFPSPAYRQLQGSTYNRASTARDQANQGTGGWFADSDGIGYIRTENTNAGGATEYVIMECNGPGAITKLWTPFFYYGFDNRAGPRIKVYLNGSNAPVLNENLIELVTRLEWSTAEYGAKPASQNSFTVPSPIAGFTARAGNCYLPIPFAASCKVTMSAKPFYDIVSYRAYAPGTVVENFSMAAYHSASNQAQMTVTGQQIGSSTNFSGGQLFETNRSLAPNQALALGLNPGAAAVRHLEIQLDPAQIASNPAALRSTILTIACDGEPTVWCPLGDFFGSANRVNPLQTWTRTVTTNHALFVCRWVMPYQTSATVTLTNLGTNAVTARLAVRTGSWAWDSRSMHFRATWRPDTIQVGAQFVDWNFVDVQGQGVLVGDAWTVLNRTSGWWGEGDEKIYVDNEYEGAKFPGMFGTGTEDYYGWAGGVNPTKTDEFSTPYLANILVGSAGNNSSLGCNINTRIRALDAVPFTARLVFDMEASPGTDQRHAWDLLMYSGVTFWYALPGATHNRPPLPAEAAKPITSLPQLNRMSDALRYGTNTSSGTGPGARWNLGEQDPGAVAGFRGSHKRMLARRVGLWQASPAPARAVVAAARTGAALVHPDAQNSSQENETHPEVHWPSVLFGCRSGDTVPGPRRHLHLERCQQPRPVLVHARQLGSFGIAWGRRCRPVQRYRRRLRRRDDQQYRFGQQGCASADLRANQRLPQHAHQPGRDLDGVEQRRHQPGAGGH